MYVWLTYMSLATCVYFKIRRKKILPYFTPARRSTERDMQDRNKEIVFSTIFEVSVQSNYEPLNRNNDCIGQWSWYYRGCWHQTCPPLEIQILDATQ